MEGKKLHIEAPLYICPRCKRDIIGARYSSNRGMLCEQCNDEVWEEEFNLDPDE